MDDIVDAVVQGMEAAKKLTVGRIDDGVGRKARDVAPPQAQLGKHGRGRDLRDLHHAPGALLAGQLLILQRKKLRRQPLPRMQVHEGAQQRLLAGHIRRGRHAAVQKPDEPIQPRGLFLVSLGHGAGSFAGLQKTCHLRKPRLCG